MSQQLETIDLDELDAASGGASSGKVASKGLKAFAKKAAGPAVGAGFAVMDGYDAYKKTKGTTADKLGAGALETFHSATWGVFKSTPAY